jgi:hypothetical protein
LKRKSVAMREVASLFDLHWCRLVASIAVSEIRKRAQSTP